MGMQDSPGGSRSGKGPIAESAPSGPDAPQASMPKVALPKKLTADIRDLSMGRFISIAALLLAILVISVLFFRVMASFFVPLFLAAMLVVIFRPLHETFYSRYGGRRQVSSMLTTTCIALLVLLPSVLLGAIAVGQGLDLVRRVRGGGLQDAVERLRGRLNLDLPHAAEFRELDTLIENMASPVPIDKFRGNAERSSQLVARLTQLLGGPGDIPPEERTEETDETIKITPSEVLLDDLESLGVQADAWSSSRDASDSAARQQARDQYDSEYWKVHNSHQEWVRSLLGNSLGAKLRLMANPSEMELRSMMTGIQEYIQPRVLPFTQLAGSYVLQLVVHFGILLMAVYFFFADGPNIMQSLLRLSPLDESYLMKLWHQFDETSRAVVLATALSSLTQGVLATIGFAACGISSLAMLFLATTFMSLIPFLGSAVVWVPVVVYVGAIQGRWAAAIGLLIFCVGVVSMIDNVVKMYVLQGRSQLHPLLALLSVLGGLQVFGPIGLLVGPMVVVFLQTLLEILNHERRGMLAESQDGGDDSSLPSAQPSFDPSS
jgi:predicted PurR-regulated permease PerM